MAGQENEPDFVGAACAGKPVDTFFPERGTAQITARDAKAICKGTADTPACPVKGICLEYALERKERFGIWGGMSERERAREARTRRVAAIKRDLQVAQATKQRSDAAKKAWKNRRTPPVASRPALKTMLDQGLITRGEYNQELIHQEHVAALAATRSKERRGGTTKRRAA